MLVSEISAIAGSFISYSYLPNAQEHSSMCSGVMHYFSFKLAFSSHLRSFNLHRAFSKQIPRAACRQVTLPVTALREPGAGWVLAALYTHFWRVTLKWHFTASVSTQGGVQVNILHTAEMSI